jgi:hypothetical protein
LDCVFAVGKFLFSMQRYPTVTPPSMPMYALPDRTLDRTGLPLVAPIFLQQIGKPIFILIHLVNLVMHGRANLVN